MTPAVLHSLLWRARSSIRLDGVGLFAGHGLADAAYRPPRLPYVAVTGPLALETESEREPTRGGVLWVRLPGTLTGEAREGTDLVPAPGSLTLLADGTASTSLALDFGADAGSAFSTTTGRAVAAAIQAALDAATWTEEGSPVTDPDRLAELGDITARWDRAGARLVLASGRRGPVEETSGRSPSSLELDGGGGSLAEALGLSGAATVAGRLVRHRLPPRRAVALDLRLDLWSGSQLGLARLLDQWTRLNPTRGRLLVRPALLAETVEDGASEVTLLSEGSSPTRWTLLQCEAAGAFADRLSGRPPTLSGGPSVGAGLVLTGSQTASWEVYEAPPVPYAWLGEHPAPTGYALSCGLTLAAGGSFGDTARVLSLEHEGNTALHLAMELFDDSGSRTVRLEATAEDGAGSALGSATAEVPEATLLAGVQLHLVADAASGALGIYLDGEEASGTVAGVGAVTPAGGHDMTLTLGDGSGNDLGFTVDHLVLHGRPLGPEDPRLRTSLTSAATWRVGEVLTLSRTEDGHSVMDQAADQSFSAQVVRIDGDTLHLDTPVEGDWPASTTLAYQRGLFFFQKQLRRRDDLMNGLYRVALEYRVSAFLEDELSGRTAPLVEVTDLQLRELSRLVAERAAAAATAAAAAEAEAAGEPAPRPTLPDLPLRPAAGAPGVNTHLDSPRAGESGP